MKKYRLSIPIVGYALFDVKAFSPEDAVQNFDVCGEWDLDIGEPDLDSNNWIVVEITDDKNRIDG
jgi:CYTH domain-containing protein